MTTFYRLLASSAVPTGFRLALADLLAAGRDLNGWEVSGMALGWNAAITAAGGSDTVPESMLCGIGKSTAGEIITIRRTGHHIRNEAKVFHPHWRDAIERGEDIPDDPAELFAPGAVTERFVPFKDEVTFLGASEGSDDSGGVKPAEDEVDVVVGEVRHATDSTAEDVAGSNPFPTQEDRP